MEKKFTHAYKGSNVISCKFPRFSEKKWNTFLTGGTQCNNNMKATRGVTWNTNQLMLSASTWLWLPGVTEHKQKLFVLHYRCFHEFTDPGNGLWSQEQLAPCAGGLPPTEGRANCPVRHSCVHDMHRVGCEDRANCSVRHSCGHDMHRVGCEAVQTVL